MCGLVGRKLWFGKLLLSITVSIMTLASVCGQKETIYGPFISGDNTFYLNDYNIEEQGLNDLIEILRQCVDFPKQITVAYFDAEINKKAYMENFQLSLNGFQEENDYVGRYTFIYAGDKSTLTYIEPEESAFYEIFYNKNEEVPYLDQQLRRLPLQEQMKHLNFKKYILNYSGSRKLEEGIPIIDGSKGEGILLFCRQKSMRLKREEQETGIPRSFLCCMTERE